MRGVCGSMNKGFVNGRSRVNKFQAISVWLCQLNGVTCTPSPFEGLIM